MYLYASVYQITGYVFKERPVVNNDRKSITGFEMHNIKKISHKFMKIVIDKHV
jgi:hypothetical protein